MDEASVVFVHTTFGGVGAEEGGDQKIRTQVCVLASTGHKSYSMQKRCNVECVCVCLCI